MKHNSRGTLRIGGVPFLNGRPLVRYLGLKGHPRIELRLEVPSLLAQRMQRAELDATLLPSIEYFRTRGYAVVPDIAIAADGTVESVRVFSRVPIEKVRSLALDQSSRTSVALASVLLKRKLGSLPALMECRPTDSLEAIGADAMLLIGDPAMKFTADSRTHVLDLGEEWKRLTGLPFVYAMWVKRRTVDSRGLHTKLVKARDEGLKNLDVIATEASADIGLSLDTCLHYLRDVMRYDLGEREIESLKLFQRFAAEDGLCPGGVEIVFDRQ